MTDACGKGRVHCCLDSMEFTCLTSTKVQILTQKAPSCSVTLAAKGAYTAASSLAAGLYTGANTVVETLDEKTAEMEHLQVCVCVCVCDMYIYS